MVAEVGEAPQAQLPFPGLGDLGLVVRHKYLSLLGRLPQVQRHEDLLDLFPDRQYRKRILRSVESYCPRKGDGWVLSVQGDLGEVPRRLIPEVRSRIAGVLQEPRIVRRTVM